MKRRLWIIPIMFIAVILFLSVFRESNSDRLVGTWEFGPPVRMTFYEDGRMTNYRTLSRGPLLGVRTPGEWEINRNRLLLNCTRYGLSEYRFEFRGNSTLLLTNIHGTDTRRWTRVD